MLGQLAVVRDKSAEDFAIGGIGSGEVCERGGRLGVVFDLCVGPGGEVSMIAALLRGGLLVTEDLLRKQKVSFEIVPSVFVSGAAIPRFAILKVHARLGNEIVNVVDNLTVSVRGITIGGVFNGRLDFFNTSFERRAWIPRFLELLVVVAEIVRGDATVRREEMGEDFLERDVHETRVGMAKGTKVK